ncbi:hypothetical protein HOU47_gp37 [Arthrobacter phage Constance]|uniref:Uncharacterized protein n=1 Tax=Arthrobacter phage Constance TaxID=2419950 RepID=A0A3G2KEN5_9CAUD|nr:hypothetical protein HOU47_gp37 [Arthrobacter phage Constance]AYN57443.1 hypothetical protein PBI_CONSTANCE_37 [Arthrobacter phage Constance]
MSWRTDAVVDACDDMKDELPRAKRALCAARRSGRDVRFNAHIAAWRIQLAIARPIVDLLDRMAAVRG